MKIALINLSGNVGKTTIARHLLLPRMPKAELVSIESANADEGEADALKGKQFAVLQQALLVADSLIVDIGASNIEDVLVEMKKFDGSHEDFDYFVVPTVGDIKQQRDTARTLVTLADIGVQAVRLRVLLNRVDPTLPTEQQFSTLEQFLTAKPVCLFNAKCAIRENEIYQLLKHDSRSIQELAEDKTDFKALIAKANAADKVKHAQALAVKRLATGVLADLDACFETLALK